VRERVQLGATLRAVTAAVNMAGTAAASASDPDRYTLSLPSFLPAQSSSILFYSRAPSRMSNRSTAPLVDRPIEISATTGGGSRNGMNFLPFLSVSLSVSLSDLLISED